MRARASAKFKVGCLDVDCARAAQSSKAGTFRAWVMLDAVTSTQATTTPKTGRMLNTSDDVSRSRGHWTLCDSVHKYCGFRPGILRRQYQTTLRRAGRELLTFILHI
jgi:hypothetical protein